MFALTDLDPRGDILDCPGGGASFTARAAAIDGVRAVASATMISGSRTAPDS